MAQILPEVTPSPGPWSADAGFDNARAYVVDIEGHLVAMCAHNDPRRHSNAKLIARAPQMFAALKAIAANSEEANEWDAVEKLEQNRLMAESLLAIMETV